MNWESTYLRPTMSARLHSCSSEMKLRATYIERQRAVSDEFVTIIHEVTLHSTVSSVGVLHLVAENATPQYHRHRTSPHDNDDSRIICRKPEQATIRVGPDLHALPQLSTHVRIKVNFAEGRPLSIGYVNVLRLAVVSPKRFIVFLPHRIEPDYSERRQCQVGRDQLLSLVWLPAKRYTSSEGPHSGFLFMRDE